MKSQRESLAAFAVFTLNWSVLIFLCFRFAELQDLLGEGGSAVSGIAAFVLMYLQDVTAAVIIELTRRRTRGPGSGPSSVTPQRGRTEE